MVQDKPISQFTQLKDIYSEFQLDYQKSRYQKLISTFETHFDKKPSFIGRAPGRVNIIGEHIDYCGYGVLPMGIERDIIAAVSVEEEISEGDIILEISNTNPKYESKNIILKSFENGIVDIDMSQHAWYNYVLAGLKGVLESNNKKYNKMKVMVDGTIPAGSGLSSSSALVVCMALATSHAQNIPFLQKQLATLCVSSERYVGVNGGGMDQACSILANKNQVLNIEFVPTLNATNVKVPELKPNCVFVVANSNVTANKVVSAKYHYNLRVVETRMAAKLMANYFELNVESSPTLRTVMDKYFEKYPITELGIEGNIKKLEIMLSKVDEILKSQTYTIESFSQQSNLNVKEIEDLFFKFNVDRTQFKLSDRTKHVFSEALRVIQFRYHCEVNSDGLANKLGELMNFSQKSCNELFDCSCPELEQLIQLNLSYGALGSRLSGAGWGGCTVSLVPKEKLNQFFEGLRTSYYKNYSNEEFNNLVFATEPAMGAGLFDELNNLL